VTDFRNTRRKKDQTRYLAILNEVPDVSFQSEETVGVYVSNFTRLWVLFWKAWYDSRDFRLDSSPLCDCLVSGEARFTKVKIGLCTRYPNHSTVLRTL